MVLLYYTMCKDLLKTDMHLLIKQHCRRTYMVIDHCIRTGGPGSPIPVGPEGPGLP